MIRDKLVELALDFQYLVVATLSGVYVSSFIINVLGIVDCAGVSFTRYACVASAFLVVGVLEAVLVVCGLLWHDSKCRVGSV